MIHIVLFEPEIPQNTGNILRSCNAFNATLHVIHPLGFILSAHAFTRAKMDYGAISDIVQHDDWEAFIQQVNGSVYYVTRYGHQPPSTFDLSDRNADVYFVFGNESSGLPLKLLAHHQDKCMRIPMVSEARSLNLANSVAIVLYETLRQQNFNHLSQEEVLKHADWLDKHR